MAQKKFFIEQSRRKRFCNCGCKQEIVQGETIIVFHAGRHGNLKLSCAERIVRVEKQVQLLANTPHIS